jgi:hypothetical protein
MALVAVGVSAETSAAGPGRLAAIHHQEFMWYLGIPAGLGKYGHMRVWRASDNATCTFCGI